MSLLRNHRAESNRPMKEAALDSGTTNAPPVDGNVTAGENLPRRTSNISNNYKLKVKTSYLVDDLQKYTTVTHDPINKQGKLELKNGDNSTSIY